MTRLHIQAPDVFLLAACSLTFSMDVPHNGRAAQILPFRHQSWRSASPFTVRPSDLPKVSRFQALAALLVVVADGRRPEQAEQWRHGGGVCAARWAGLGTATDGWSGLAAELGPERPGEVGRGGPGGGGRRPFSWLRIDDWPAPGHAGR